MVLSNQPKNSVKAKEQPINVAQRFTQCPVYTEARLTQKQRDYDYVESTLGDAALYKHCEICRAGVITDNKGLFSCTFCGAREPLGGE
jgi:hypothetical protein